MLFQRLWRSRTKAIRGVTEIDLADLEAQQDDEALDDLPSDITNEEYQPLP